MSTRHRNRNASAGPAGTAPQQDLARPLAVSPRGRAIVVNPVTQPMRRSDEDTQVRVSKELLHASGIGTHVAVAVTGGVVTLSGEVGSLAERVAVNRAAMHVAGVRALADDLQIRAPGTSGANDTDG